MSVHLPEREGTVAVLLPGPPPPPPTTHIALTSNAQSFLRSTSKVRAQWWFSMTELSL